MATRLAQVAALLDGFDRIELSYIHSCAAKRLNETADLTRCFLLDLPAELRNHIYHYVATNHLQEATNMSQMPAMMQVNKQVRTEFRDVYYGKGIIEIAYPSTVEREVIPEGNPITDRAKLARVLRKVQTNMPVSKASAERTIKSMHRFITNGGKLSIILIHEVWRDDGYENGDYWRWGLLKTSVLRGNKADL